MSKLKTNKNPAPIVELIPCAFLKPLQEAFIKQLVQTQSTDDFLDYLSPSGTLSAEQQLAIYQNNTTIVLQKTLAQVYPICQKILGADYFTQIARIYIINHPSIHFDLNHYGEFFSDFIQSLCQLQIELNDYIYLSDLSRLEWFYHQSYYAENAAIFDFMAFAKLTSQQQAQCQFKLAPCLKLMASNFPILSIWQVNQLEDNKQPIVKFYSENVCIFRKNNRIQMNLIDTKKVELLMHIKQNSTLQEITNAGYGKQLTELIQLGWIDQFVINNV